MHKLKENGWFLHGSQKKNDCGALSFLPPQVLSRIMGFFYRIFLSRIIGAEGLGLYQMIFPVLALALSVTSAGLSTAISHQVSRKNALGDKRGIWNIFFAGAAFSLLFSFLAAGVLRSYAGVLAEVFLKDVRCEELLKYLALAIPFASLHAIVTGCFIGRKKTGLPALSQLFEQLVRILSSLLIWQIFQEKGFAPTPLIAVGGMLASEILTSLLTLLLLLFQTPVFAPPSLSIMRKSLEKLTEIALPISGSRFFLGFSEYGGGADSPAASFLRLQSFSEAYSHYGILTGMALPLVLFPSAVTGAVSMLLIPEISEADTLNDRQAILRTARSTVAGCLYLGIFCTGGFFFSLRKGAGLFLFQSEEAGSYIRILGWICPFLYLGTTLSSILNSLGKRPLSFFQNLPGILIRILFVWFGIPRFGILGCLLGVLFFAAYRGIVGLRTVFEAVPEMEFDLKDLLMPLLFLGWSLCLITVGDGIMSTFFPALLSGIEQSPVLLFLRGGLFTAAYSFFTLYFFQTHAQGRS